MTKCVICAMVKKGKKVKFSELLLIFFLWLEIMPGVYKLWKQQHFSVFEYVGLKKKFKGEGDADYVTMFHHHIWDWVVWGISRWM